MHARRERNFGGAKVEVERRRVIENDEERTLTGSAPDHARLASGSSRIGMKLTRADLSHVDQQGTVAGARDIHDPSL
jgi:hypothetical protein